MPPMRSPRPAATTTTPTSRGKRSHQLVHVVEPYERCARDLHRAAGGAENPMKAEAHRFRYPPLDRTTRTYLASEPDLSEKDHIGGGWPIVETGKECCGNSQIGSGLVQADARSDLYEDIEVGKGSFGSTLEHGEKNGEPARIQARGDPLRRTIAGLGCERLHLHQHRPSPFHQGGHRAAAVALG